MIGKLKHLLHKNRCSTQANLFKNPSLCTINRGNSIIVNRSLSENINKSYIAKNYKIVKTIHETSSRGMYIIESSSKTKYFAKINPKSKNCENEANIFRKLINHNNINIVKFIEWGEDDICCYFIYEYIDGITLDKYIKDNNITNKNIKDIFLQIVNGLHYLHSLDIIHCDIKLNNIMITENLEIKIIDFDLSIISKCDYLGHNIFGTIQYIAPESADLYIYSKKSDIWSLGIVMYIILTGEYPYIYTSSNAIEKDNMYRRNKFKHINFSLIKDNNFKYIIMSMLKFIDCERITTEEILKYKW